MMNARTALLPVIAALLFSLSGASTARASAADWVDARYEIFGFAGLHVLTDRTAVEEAADRYAIVTDLQSRGVARLFVDLTSHSEVHGRIANGAPHPADYRAEIRRNGADRHYGLDYRGDGAVVDVSGPPPSGRPLLVAEPQIRDTVDQLTAFLMVERQLAQRGACALTVRVFDGSGLYDLRFTDVKRETLSADGYQNFAGPTQVCGVKRENLVVGPDHDDETYQRGRIWYARLISGDRLVPVRLEFDTTYGVVKAYLTELHGHGINLHLIAE